jgi:hypothetical protein
MYTSRAARPIEDLSVGPSSSGIPYGIERLRPWSPPGVPVRSTAL